MKHNTSPNFRPRVLRQLVHLYCLACPSILFPVDRYRKFGAGGPVGLLADSTNAAIVCAYLGDDTASKLREELRMNENLNCLLEWFAAQPDLTDSEIDEDWRKFASANKLEQYDNKPHRIASCRSIARAIGWHMNYRTKPSKLELVPDEVVDTMYRKLRDWP